MYVTVPRKRLEESRIFLHFDKKYISGQFHQPLWNSIFLLMEWWTFCATFVISYQTFCHEQSAKWRYFSVWMLFFRKKPWILLDFVLSFVLRWWNLLNLNEDRTVDIVCVRQFLKLAIVWCSKYEIIFIVLPMYSPYYI